MTYTPGPEGTPMSSALHPGSIFGGRYVVIRCIAMGGMGAVYEVQHLETERRRALKIMHPHILQSDDLRDRFKREAKVAAHIESEYIVDVFDAGVDEATQMPFLVMELLRGEELGERLKRVGRFPPEETLLYLQQTAVALDKTHKASIVHRDLKPANLFRTEREDGPPRIKVLDFGIAKVLVDGATQANATSILGTPFYMSPEQFRPGFKLSPAVDIFALGMMTYTFLVGHPYWYEELSAENNIYAFLPVAAFGPTEPASARAARQGVQLPEGFDAWFGQVTAPNPADRFATATLAVNALAEVFGLGALAASFSVASRPSLPTEMGPPRAGSSSSITGTGMTGVTGAPPDRRKESIVAAAIGFVVICGGVLLAVRLLGKPPSDISAGGVVATVEPTSTSSAAPAGSVVVVTAAPAVTSVTTAAAQEGPSPEPSATPKASAPASAKPAVPAKVSGTSVAPAKSAPAKAAAPTVTVKQPPKHSRQ